MLEIEKQNKLIELRAKGLTFDSVADELHCSKSTVIRWSKILEKEILLWRKMELDDLKEKLLISKTHRLEFYAENLKDIKERISETPLLLGYDTLVNLGIKILNSLDRSEFLEEKLYHEINSHENSTNSNENSDSTKANLSNIENSNT